MPQATFLFEDREVMADGSIIQMRIWRVPKPVPPSEHRFKYSLFFGYPGNGSCGSTMNVAKATTNTYERSRHLTSSSARND